MLVTAENRRVLSCQEVSQGRASEQQWADPSLMEVVIILRTYTLPLKDGIWSPTDVLIEYLLCAKHVRLLFISY